MKTVLNEIFSPQIWYNQIFTRVCHCLCQTTAQPTVVSQKREFNIKWKHLLSLYLWLSFSLSLSLFFFTFFLELVICLSTNLCSAPFNSFNHLVWGCIVDTKADGLCQMLFLTLKPNNKTKLTMAGEWVYLKTKQCCYFCGSCKSNT